MYHMQDSICLIMLKNTNNAKDLAIVCLEDNVCISKITYKVIWYMAVSL